jgi:hypothetical protein
MTTILSIIAPRMLCLDPVRFIREAVVMTGALVCGGCGHSMSTQQIYDVPLAQWRSVPSVDQERFPISEGRAITIPRSNGIFASPYPSDSNDIYMYFNLDGKTARLIDPEKIASYRDIHLIEMTFGKTIETIAASLDIDIDGQSPRGKLGILSPVYAFSISGSGEARGRNYYYRCSRATYDESPSPLDCKIVLRGEIASVISIKMSLPKSSREQLDQIEAEELRRASQEAIDIERSFVRGA